MCGIDRVLFSGERPFVFGKVFSLWSVVMAVGVAVVFSGTYSNLAFLSLFNLNSWQGWWLRFVRVCGSFRVRLGGSIDILCLF